MSQKLQCTCTKKDEEKEGEMISSACYVDLVLTSIRALGSHARKCTSTNKIYVNNLDIKNKCKTHLMKPNYT